MNTERGRATGVPRVRQRGDRHGLDECVRRVGELQSSFCTWPGCTSRQAWWHGLDDFREIPLCTGHIFETWRIARDSAERHEVRKPTALVEISGKIREVERPVARSGWVYYLRIGEHIKIGYATVLENRLRQYPPTSEFLHAHRGTKVDEKVTHDLLTVHRVAAKEWYADCPEVRAYIACMVNRYGAKEDPRPKRQESNGNAVGMRRRSGPTGRYVR